MNKKNEQLAQIAKEKLNVVIITENKRSDGSVRIQEDYTNCPSLTEQHSAHLTDLNYLIAKHQPDEMAAYIAARNQYRQEIVGHDFSQEPTLQEALNIVYRSKQEFENLPEEIRKNFKNHLEFIKFIDNPDNAERMTKMGLLTQKQVDIITLSKKSALEEAEQQRKGDTDGSTKKSTAHEYILVRSQSWLAITLRL